MSKGKFKGWKGILYNAGKFVPAEEGFAYACQQLGIVEFNRDAPEAEELVDMLEDWYFSGNWIKVYEGEVDL